MIDAVLCLHQNPATCGVSKFSVQIAQRLKVRCYPLHYIGCRHPLLSVKFSELTRSDVDVLLDHYRKRRFDLFLHDLPTGDALTLVLRAERVYAGNRVIWDALHPQFTHVVPAFCPSTVEGDATRGAYRVLIFGMAHKLNLPHFVSLKAQLDAEHDDYTVELSTAVHEGSPWDTALTESVTAMRGIFGSRLRVLGYLGDDALAKELQDCDAVAAFYQPALRANNTSYWAAVDAGKKVYTNRDEHSPAEHERVTWDRLLEIVRA